MSNPVVVKWNGNINILDLDGEMATVNIKDQGAVYLDDDVIYYSHVPYRLSSAMPTGFEGEFKIEIQDLRRAIEEIQNVSEGSIWPRLKIITKITDKALGTARCSQGYRLRGEEE